MMDFGLRDDKAPVVKISIPLRRITTPRSIATSFGNIISRLQSQGDNTEVPGSTELESSVLRWLKAHGNQTQHVQVWALVTPKEKWIDGESVEAPALQRMLESGSRLHKVLSGGGGWGSKKGLLALDPDLDYGRVPNPSSSTVITFPQMEEQLELSGVGEVVRAGDVVTFYVSDVGNPSNPVSADPPDNRHTFIHKSVSVTLGTTPSTIDSLLIVDGDCGIATVKDYIYAANHFGMVSEQGMAMKVAFTNANVSQPGLLGKEEHCNWVETKLDPPFTRFDAYIEES